MSNNPINELETKFNDFIDEKDDYRFFLRLSNYFQFIENTFPLDNIIKKLFSSSFELSMFKNIEGLYSHVVLGEPPTTFSISPSSVSGSGIRSLHKRLVEEAKKSNLIEKKVFMRDAEGNYYYKDRQLPFSTTSIIYLIFDYLYFHKPNNYASYKEIDTYLARNGKKPKSNKEEQSARIGNAIKAYNKNKKYPSEIGGVEVFKIERGSGVRLNNPNI